MGVANAGSCYLVPLLPCGAVLAEYAMVVFSVFFVVTVFTCGGCPNTSDGQLVLRCEPQQCVHESAVSLQDLRP